MPLLLADMTGGDVAAIIVACLTAVLVAFLCVALTTLNKTMRVMRETIEQLRRETVPVVVDMRETVQRANLDLDRVDNVLNSAESIGATLDSGSRLLYLAFSNPIIKALAVGAGTARAARRLRRAG
jgi:ascorbate-specific PTS system EIIC-type component UlaA